MPRSYSRKEKVSDSDHSSVTSFSSSTESLELLPRHKTYNKKQRAVDYKTNRPNYYCKQITEEKQSCKNPGHNELKVCDKSLFKGELSKEADQDHKIQKYICSKPLQQTLKKIKKFSKRSKVTFSSEILVDELNFNGNKTCGAGDAKNDPGVCSPILGRSEVLAKWRGEKIIPEGYYPYEGYNIPFPYNFPHHVASNLQPLHQNTAPNATQVTNDKHAFQCRNIRSQALPIIVAHQSNSIASDSQNNSFPFQNTPSGNLKVEPDQVVFNNKDLSLIAADPERTKVIIKSNPTENKNSVDTEKLKRPECAKEYSSYNKKPILTTSSDGDLYSSESCAEKQTIEHNDKKHPLVREISLTKMGFNKNLEIDWDQIKLPRKTDLHSLIQHRIINQMCPDVVMKIGSHEFPCHLIVLQCYSSYFNNNPVSKCEIPEEHVSKDAFECIYDWMLNIKPDSYKILRRDNVLEIFNSAQYFGIKELEEQCWAFIDNEELFSEEKAFMLYLDARKYGNTLVMELMVPRIRIFFLVLVSSKEYLELLAEEVCIFLNSNYICVHSEIEVFMSGVRWLLHDWESRKHTAVDIMKCVRFGLIPPWQLVDIRRNPDSFEFNLITQREEVAKLIEDGLAFAIVKYWYGHNEKEYMRWLNLLGLSEPAMRNWIDSDNKYKPYVLYSEFLNDLANYQRLQKKNNRLNKETNKGVTDGGDSNKSDSNELSYKSITNCHHSTKKSKFPSPLENVQQNLDNVSVRRH